MSDKRENFPEKQEARSRRVLEEHSRRWPTNPNTFYILLIGVLLLILFIAFG